MSDDVSQPASTALILRPQVLPSLAQFEIERQLAGRLWKARGFLPNHYMVGPDEERFAKVLAAIEYGRAVGIEPMIALQNLNNIDGKIGASALLIGAQLRKAGYDLATSWYDKDGNACPKESPAVWGCKVVISKNQRETGQGTFSLTDAQRAGLIKENSGWARYPKDMLYARALTQAGREGAQDAILGMAYTAEELGADVDADGQVVSIPPPPPGGFVDVDYVDVVAPGVSEAKAVSPPPPAAIQPTPPAPASVEVKTEPTTPGGESVPASQGQATGSGGTDGSASGADAVASPPQTPNAAPIPPLAGTNVSRRLGVGRSISPVRKNVTTVQPTQASETPATAPEEPAAPAPQPAPAPSQPAPPALTDEPVLPEPEDPGKAVYLNQRRGDLRIQTAELFRVNALLDNVKRGLEGQDPNEVPLATPSEASDAALAARIDHDWPGRKLENLGLAEIDALSERFDANLAKKRAVMKERGISEE